MNTTLLVIAIIVIVAISLDALLGTILYKIICTIFQYDNSPFKTWWLKILVVLFLPLGTLICVIALLFLWFIFWLFPENPSLNKHGHYPD